MKSKIGVILIGGSGYGAKEFLRLSEFHPEITIEQITSRGNSQLTVGEIHQNLVRYKDLKFSAEATFESLKDYPNKFAVLALPYESSIEFIKNNQLALEKNKIRIIDLSGGCRLKNKSTRTKFYPDSSHLEDKIYDSFQYGLPELFKTEIKSANNIANPGCYATCGILSLAPITKLPISHVAIDGKSGSSGAGRTLSEDFHHPELNASGFAYKIGKHRHQPEIRENLGLSEETEFTFAPHVIPISRGMMVTTYAFFKESQKKGDVNLLFKNFYEASPFVRIRSNPPKIKNVIGSNFCDIFIEAEDKQVVISVVIDNLTKGMAGQAIQNMNIMSGLNEDLGLIGPGIGLV